MWVAEYERVWMISNEVKACSDVETVPIGGKW